MTKDECIRVAQQMVLSSYLEEVVSGVDHGEMFVPMPKALSVEICSARE